MTKKIKLDIYERSILELLSDLSEPVTASQIAEAIGIHQTTVQRRIIMLKRKKLIDYTTRGNRKYCFVLD